MIQLHLDREQVDTILEALEIADAWHKHEKRFSHTIQIVRRQIHQNGSN